MWIFKSKIYQSIAIANMQTATSKQCVIHALKNYPIVSAPRAPLRNIILTWQYLNDVSTVTYLRLWQLVRFLSSSGNILSGPRCCLYPVWHAPPPPALRARRAEDSYKWRTVTVKQEWYGGGYGCIMFPCNRRPFSQNFSRVSPPPRRWPRFPAHYLYRWKSQLWKGLFE